MEREYTAGSRVLPTEEPKDDLPDDMKFLTENLKSKIEKLNEEGCKPNHNQLQVRGSGHVFFGEMDYFSCSIKG